MKRRILGWILVVIGMTGLITGAVREGGVNLLWGFVAMIGAGLVGPWPWFSRLQRHPAGTKMNRAPNTTIKRTPTRALRGSGPLISIR